MKKVAVDAVDSPATTSPADVFRPLSGALETSGLAINYVELAPGEQFGYDYHRHLDQEELFYVQQGTATFDTESGETEVSAGEVIRFEPGEFQLGVNRGGERVVAVTLGAPRETDAIEYRRACPTCETATIQTPELDREQRTVAIECTECDSVVDEVSPS